MRTSSPQLFYRGLNAMLAVQDKVQKYQLQIATGTRVRTAADDPVAMARIQSIGEQLSAIEQFTRGANLADLRLSDQETTLSNVGNLLQRTRELVLRAKSPALSADDRRYLAAEVRQRFDELLQLANARNASGEYIFAGTAVDTMPFVADGSGVVTFQGNDNVRRLWIAEGRSLAEGFSGAEAFMAVRNGNGHFVMNVAAANTGTGRLVADTLVDPTTYVPHDFRIYFTAPDTFDVIDDTTGATVLAAQPYIAERAIAFNGLSVAVTGAPATGDEFTISPSTNQSIFATVGRAVAALEREPSTPASAAQQTFELDRALLDIDQALSSILTLRTALGARQNTIASQIASNEDLATQLKTVKSHLEDVDPVAAISELARQSQALEAAQQAFVRVQGLSLFNFL